MGGGKGGKGAHFPVILNDLTSTHTNSHNLMSPSQSSVPSVPQRAEEHCRTRSRSFARSSHAGRLADRLLGTPFLSRSRFKTSRGNEHAGGDLEFAHPSGQRNIVSRAYAASLARTHARTNGTNRIRFPGWTHPPNLRLINTTHY